MDLKREIHAFIIASSIVSFFITALYIGYGMSQNKKQLQHIPHIEWSLLLMPIIYGIFGVLSYQRLRYFGLHGPMLMGGILGLILSLVGRFSLNLPKLLFGHDENEWLVHVYAVPLYALIFMYIVTPLQRYFVN
jgi:hypothetical protein